MLSLGVETTNKTANSALITKSETVNKIINALKAAGVKENETSTASFNILPNYNYSRYSTKQIVTGFTVTNTIQLQSFNVSNMPKWIDVSIAAGANKINGIDFRLSFRLNVQWMMRK